MMIRTLLALTFSCAVACAQEYEVLYTKQVNNNDNIYSINELGQTRQITNHPRKDSSPMMSPDGTQMVFTSERQGWWKIWLLDIESNSFRQLTRKGGAAYSPSWSPDGRSIVFVSGTGSSSEVYTIKPDGSGLRQITSGGNNTMPTWANNGRIYYSQQLKGIYQIISINPDGTDEEQITSNGGDKLMAQRSPDGRKILYYGNQDGNMEIYTLDLQTNMTNRLTNHELMDIRPRWSPDGQLIVFERGNKRDNQQIYLMNADGSNQRQLTSSGYHYAPSFNHN